MCLCAQSNLFWLYRLFLFVGIRAGHHDNQGTQPLQRGTPEEKRGRQREMKDEGKDDNESEAALNQCLRLRDREEERLT